MENLLDESFDVLARPMWPNYAGMVGGGAVAVGAAWLLAAESSAAPFAVFAAGAVVLAIAWLRIGRKLQSAACVGVPVSFFLSIGSFHSLGEVRTFALVLGWSFVAFAVGHALTKGHAMVRILGAAAAIPAITIVLDLHLGIGTPNSTTLLIDVVLACFSLMGIAIAIALVPPRAL